MMKELKDLLAQPAMEMVEDVPHALLPPGYTIQSLESMLKEPRRTKREVIAHDLAGLVEYTKKFKNEKTALYCGPATAPKVIARIDDHRPGAPSHQSHSCVYPCPHTQEWLTWKGGDKKQMSQVAFGEFIEANILDIRSPSGSELLRSARNFTDSGRVEFQSSIRGSDGRVQFKFVEEKTQESGAVQFPEEITMGLPVFEGVRDDAGKILAYELKARLRYRISKDDGLVLWYELDRPDLVLKAAYAALIAQVEKALTLGVFRAL